MNNILIWYHKIIQKINFIKEQMIYKINYLIVLNKKNKILLKKEKILWKVDGDKVNQINFIILLELCYKLN